MKTRKRHLPLVKCVSIILIIFCMILDSFGQASYSQLLTTVSNVRMTISNLGIIGNDFKGPYVVSGWPSAVYPAGSGIEHLFEGGLWVGAYVAGQPRVTTGSVDASAGYTTGASGYDFTAAIGSIFGQRSSYYNNPYYSPKAISHQDFVSDFTDTNVFVPGTSIRISGHTPLGLGIHFESYNWDYSFANFYVILHFIVKNVGHHNLDSVFIGYYGDPVVRDINVTPPGGSAFYDKGGVGYADTLNMAYAFDADGDTSLTRSYMGYKYLGANDKYGFHSPATQPNFHANFNTWNWSNASDPIFYSPSGYVQKYGKLAVGLNDTTYFKNWTAIQDTVKTPGNRGILMSAGPFQTMLPGDSIDIAFAVVFGQMVNDGHSVEDDDSIQHSAFFKNAYAAQLTYNGQVVNGVLERYILPTPAAIPTTRIVALNHEIDIYWSNNAESSIDPVSHKPNFEGYRVYMSQLGFDVQDIDVSTSMQDIAQYDKKGDNLFFETGFDSILLPAPVQFAGDTTHYYYKYVIKNVLSGWQWAISVTSFTTGDPALNISSLESSILGNLKRIFPGTPANNSLKNNHPFVYPNPYYSTAAWEGQTISTEDHKIIFANLPSTCLIKVYTVAGDLVKTIHHDPSYTGSDIKWFATFSDTTQTQFSGGEHAWDLLSDNEQIIARGLYIFSVDDLNSGQSYQGKFLIIK